MRELKVPALSVMSYPFSPCWRDRSFWLFQIQVVPDVLTGGVGSAGDDAEVALVFEGFEPGFLLGADAGAVPAFEFDEESVVDGAGDRKEEVGDSGFDSGAFEADCFGFGADASVRDVEEEGELRVLGLHDVRPLEDGGLLLFFGGGEEVGGRGLSPYSKRA